jgi:3-dehydroquinate dehydratase-1
MHIGKPIQVGGKSLGRGRYPTVCAPLVGHTREQVLLEVEMVSAKQPDLLEWRVDYFDDIGDLGAVLSLAREIRHAACGIPVLFTRRSTKEGGESIPLTEEQVVTMIIAVCTEKVVELLDFEMDSDPAHIDRIRRVAKANGIGLVLSFHNFEATPPLEVLSQRFAMAQRLGADVAKIAVMPKRPEDLISLMSATLESSQQLDIPLVSMSMGAGGSPTRLLGWIFGSAMTFVVGSAASAPGQVPIEDMDTVLKILQKSMEDT